MIPSYPYTACINMDCHFEGALPLIDDSYYECPICKYQLHWTPDSSYGDWMAANYKIKRFKLIHNLEWVEY